MIYKLRAISLLVCACTIGAQSELLGCEPCSCSSSLYGLRADCEGKVVTRIPPTLPKNVTILRLAGTCIEALTKDSLSKYTQLQDMNINGDECLTEVLSEAFAFNTELTALVITHCPKLRKIDSGVFGAFRRLRSINLESNCLESLPNFSAFQNLESTVPVTLDLDNNQIYKIETRAWCGRAHDGCSTANYLMVSLRNNSLEEIDESAFAGVKIVSLDLGNNMALQKISDTAFSGCIMLHNLSLSNTAITKLPVLGLENLEELSIDRTPLLQILPPTVSYPKVARVRVHLQQHCCAFKYPKIQDSVVYEQVKQKQEALCSSESLRRLPTQSPAVSASFVWDRGQTDKGSESSHGFILRRLFSDGGGFGKFISGWGPLGTVKTSSPPRLPSVDHWLNSTPPAVEVGRPRTADPCSSSDGGWNLHLWREAHLVCTPAPNAFNPCVDVLEADWLRAALWLVALLTLVGNASVLAFTACVRTATPITVAKFLVANLAIADLALVTHLVALAAEDATTRGEYFNHAQHWQQGGWCDATGFIGVFGAELSVFTLCAITLERWYAISHAINLTKRMQMRHAVAIMCAGWVICATVAAAPLFDVSSYRVTSMCLPFRYESQLDKGYIIFLLLVNAGAFILVLSCYISMFLQVRGSDAWSSGDAYIAKRMALLVFTDFVCWGPVAIVAALSAGGVDVTLSSLTDSDLTHAKMVLAIFYPFNACANPFLYAILTKQFRNDVIVALNRCGFCQRKMCHVLESWGNSHSSSPRHQGVPRGGVTRPSEGSNTHCTVLMAHSSVSSPDSIVKQKLACYETASTRARAARSSSECGGSWSEPPHDSCHANVNDERGHWQQQSSGTSHSSWKSRSERSCEESSTAPRKGVVPMGAQVLEIVELEWSAQEGKHSEILRTDQECPASTSLTGDLISPPATRANELNDEPTRQDTDAEECTEMQDTLACLHNVQGSRESGFYSLERPPICEIEPLLDASASEIQEPVKSLAATTVQHPQFSNNKVPERSCWPSLEYSKVISIS